MECKISTCADNARERAVLVPPGSRSLRVTKGRGVAGRVVRLKRRVRGYRMPNGRAGGTHGSQGPAPGGGTEDIL